ncbi:uncharacterized protein LOC129293164 [Prosopis cineraria]|uniref:uncharacterized protein LOC129293164 n=1 Tax=Prosopis cineraria TaxID=364024 RepID=UPI00240FF18A|nr:uncharacterized protein LOC129293164 [Prosopis cineraria]
MNAYIRNQAGHSTEWRKRAEIKHTRKSIRGKISDFLSSKNNLDNEARQEVPKIARIVETCLFDQAASENEYKNQDTLVQRLENQLQGTIFGPQVNSYNTNMPMKGPSSGLSNVWHNRNQAAPASQMFAASNINFTDYSTVVVNNTNKYEFSNRRQSQGSAGNETIFSSNGCSFLRCTGSDGFSNFNASGGTSNLKSNTKPIFSHFQQQHGDHVRMDRTKYSGNESSAFVTTLREPPLSVYGNLMIPPFVRTEASPAFNNFPVQNSCHRYSTVNNLMQYQPQNLDSQPNCQHFKQSYVHGAKGYTAETRPCFVSKDETCCQLQGQKTLNQPLLSSRAMNVNQQFSSESSACLDGSNGASWHFDECRRGDCHSLDSANSMTMTSTVRGHGYLEDILPPAKRLKIEPTFDVSMRNNGIHNPWDYNMVLTNSPEGLPELQQQPESSFPIYSKITENNTESSANAKQDSASFSEIDNNMFGIETIIFECIEASQKLRDSYPKSNDEVTRNFGENDSGSNSSVHTFQKDPSADRDGVHERGGFYRAAKKTTKEVIEPKADLEKKIEFSNPKIMTVSDGELGHTFDNETISQGSEVYGVLEESYPESNMDAVSRSGFSVQTFHKDRCGDIDGVQERGGFDMARKKTTEEVIEPKADLEKEMKSSNPKIMTVSVGVFGDTSDNETISQVSKVDGVLGESYPESDGVIARNSSNTVNRSGCSLQKDPCADIMEGQVKNGIDRTGKSITDEVIEPKYDLKQGTVSLDANPITSGVSYDLLEQTDKSRTIPKGIEAGNTLEDSYLNSDDVKLTVCNPRNDVGFSNSSDHTLQKDLISDIDDVQSRNEFNQSVKNNTEEVTEPKSDLESGESSSKPTSSCVSLTETFTYDQIRQHILSLRQGFGQSTLEEIGVGDNTCTLCGLEKLFFAPVPIYCLSCGKRIKRNTKFYSRAGERKTEQCFCSPCFKNSPGESIQFNGVSIPKTILESKKNDDAPGEDWAQCDKCQRWQHQICALFNNKRNLEGKFQYVCPKCCSKEIEEGIRTPLGTSVFGAKDLPRTKLSDHIEKRLFSRLEHERAHKAKVEGKNVDEISGAEKLTVRVVQSVEKQLKVKREFLDILCGENYPPEFPYTSKVILLFQNIEGVDMCIYVVFVQEFGSECGHPNHRSVYISYLDSVKYFRPQRETVTGEALRTFVYHEILIGYLEFCKKRGFGKCYIWACPPLKGEDYVLYCHPQSQKTPKGDKLRHWYRSMLSKATEESIVVGLTNIYDHFFVPAEKCYSKVTAARLPYFDGDYWSGAAVDVIKRIEQESKEEYNRKLKQVLTKRALKAMGHANPSKGATKDILVMQKLGQTISPVKEDFIIVQLQHACTLCHEVILSGKRWFCPECKEYQQCDRCHTSYTHTSKSGETHKLCQVVVDDIPCDTKENDIILDSELFGNRVDFLSFCQENRLQFDTLRHAKHSSMMLLYYLKNSVLNVDPRCSICSKDNVSQLSWQCEICPQLSICSACYEEKGANSHEHVLRQAQNQVLEQKTTRIQKLLEVLRHASQCMDGAEATLKELPGLGVSRPTMQ